MSGQNSKLMACQKCKQRKLKCDRQWPSCRRCLASRMLCPGYHIVDPQDASASQLASVNTARDSATNVRYRALSAASMVAAIPSSLSIKPYQVASSYFIANFAPIPNRCCITGPFDFLRPLLTISAPNCLRHALEACALATFSKRFGSSAKFRKQTLVTYGQALITTGAALKCEKEQYADATLGSVLLLSLFESINAGTYFKVAWRAHVDAAELLVANRGPQQLSTEVGRGLFIAVRYLTSINMLSSEKALHTSTEWDTSNLGSDRSTLRIAELAISSGNLRCQARHLLTRRRSVETEELVAKLVAKCQKLDQHFIEWSTTLPENLGQTTCGWQEAMSTGAGEQDIYPGYIDSYSDFLVASMWNTMRCSRIQLASITVRCAAWRCSPYDYRTTPEYAAATKTWSSCIEHIIASAPFMLGHVKRSQTISISKGFACSDDGMKMAMAGQLLVWPLACILRQDYLNNAQREWTLGRLWYIHHHLGIESAYEVTKVSFRLPSMLIEYGSQYMQKLGI